MPEELALVDPPSEQAEVPPPVAVSVAVPPPTAVPPLAVPPPLAAPPPVAEPPDRPPERAIGPATYPGKSRPHWLSREELTRRVALYSASVVEELHKTAQRQLDAEDRREGVLITKAAGLLGQSGLAITVAGAIVGLIVKEPALVDRLGTGWLIGLAVAYTIVFGCGTVAAIYAMRVVLVRGDFEEIDEHTVFDTKELLDADRPLAALQSPEQGLETATVREPNADSTAATRYRRWMIPHLWSIYQRHNEIHDEKAKLLRRGQIMFTAFVAGITLLVPLLTVALLAHPAPKDPPMSTSPRSSSSTSTEGATSQPAPQPSVLPPSTTAPAQPQPPLTGVPPAGRRLQGADPRPGTIRLRGR